MIVRRTTGRRVVICVIALVVRRGLLGRRVAIVCVVLGRRRRVRRVAVLGRRRCVRRLVAVVTAVVSRIPGAGVHCTRSLYLRTLAARGFFKNGKAS